MAMRMATIIASSVVLFILIHQSQAYLPGRHGWNPKSSTELFLGLLPYLLVFVIVPICLLLVCWCSKYVLRVCCKRVHQQHTPAFLHRFFPTTTPTPTPTSTAAPASLAVTQPQQLPPETLFTNYTNYNPMLEGELDLFPISYNTEESRQQQCRRNQQFISVTCNFLRAEAISRTDDSVNEEEIRVDDPPPYYPEDPPPSYDTLYSEKIIEENTASSKGEMEIDNVTDNSVCVN
uniref:Uncharacterized protein n=1 Tax=Strigamia maritima TaxID=126957 RepID=T1IQ04_STRMM